MFWKLISLVARLLYNSLYLSVLQVSKSVTLDKKCNFLGGYSRLYHLLVLLHVIIGNVKIYILNIRVWPNIRPFSISGRITDIETIRILDTRLLSNNRYLVTWRISGNLPDIGPFSISSRLPNIRHYKSAGYPVSGKKSIWPNTTQYHMMNYLLKIRYNCYFNTNNNPPSYLLRLIVLWQLKYMYKHV